MWWTKGATSNARDAPIVERQRERACGDSKHAGMRREQPRAHAPIVACLPACLPFSLVHLLLTLLALLVEKYK
jgi:hypothetical protein